MVHGQCKWKDRQTRPCIVAAYIVSAQDLIVTLQNRLPSHDLIIYFCSDRFAVDALLHVTRIAARYLTNRFDPTWEEIACAPVDVGGANKTQVRICAVCARQ